MLNYLIRRCLLLPLTLFFIILVNFAIVNLAPGDPVTVSEITQQGAARREDRATAMITEDRYLQFREFYGLTLPILFNSWPFISQQEIIATLQKLVDYQKEPGSEIYSNQLKNWDFDSAKASGFDLSKSTQYYNMGSISKVESRELSLEPKTNFSTGLSIISFKEYDGLRVKLGDQARFIMPLLLAIVEDENQMISIRQLAVRFFVRGGLRQAILGPNLTLNERAYNKKITEDNNSLMLLLEEPLKGDIQEQSHLMRIWFEKNKDYYHFAPTFQEKLKIFFFETRFVRYMSRVLQLDFGTMRNDSNKTVVSEVIKRFKYSLTLSVIPLALTFFFCIIFGFIMAYRQAQWPDYSLNLLFLILYAIPVFVVAPLLVEKIALVYHFPFTNEPIPTSGFTSSEAIYAKETSIERLFDILRHIFLPIIAIMYGSLAAHSRLARTAILEVKNQDYIRTAKAKGVPPLRMMYQHVGRNAAITIVTALAGSLGVVLGGSLIVETLFEINGFGRFFYEAVLNRDYNVIMFSAIAGSILTLGGYLLADIAYTVLDPRVTLD